MTQRRPKGDMDEPLPRPGPVLDEVALLRNELSQLSMLVLEIARILKQPAIQTMKDLPAHARNVMAALDTANKQFQKRGKP